MCGIVRLHACAYIVKYTLYLHTHTHTHTHTHIYIYIYKVHTHIYIKRESEVVRGVEAIIGEKRKYKEFCKFAVKVTIILKSTIFE